jgi:hypothetical protein
VVHVQHNAGGASQATAIAAPEAVALQDREAELRGQGIAGPHAVQTCRRFGIDVERPLAQSATPDPDLLAAIEEAVARGVARGLREALAERGEGDQEDSLGAAEDPGRPEGARERSLGALP